MIKRLIVIVLVLIIPVIIFINIYILPLYLLFILLLLQFYFYKYYNIRFICFKKLINVIKTKKLKFKTKEIIIKTFDGSNCLTHPSLVKNNDKYIMVYTPYNNCNIDLENPCIAFSKDLNNFDEPSEGINPLLPLIKNTSTDKIKKYYNDPFVYIEDEKIKIIYRYTEEQKDQINNTLYIIESNDGISWTKPKRILNDDDSYMSSSFVKSDKKYYLFYFDYNNTLSYKTSIDKIKWELKKQIIIPDIVPWHGEVKYHKNKFILLFVDKKFDLYFAELDVENNKCLYVKKLDINYDIKDYYSNSIKYKSTFIIEGDNLTIFVPFRYDKINLFGEPKVKRKWVLTKTVISLNEKKEN